MAAQRPPRKHRLAMAYEYSPRVLETWNELPRSTALWDQVKHLETQVAYFKNRAESAEQRMFEHHCEGDQ